MHSLTAQMISQNQATSAMIAKKLSETEGVLYEVVKESKGYRVIKSKPLVQTVVQIVTITGGPPLNPKDQSVIHALGDKAAKKEAYHQPISGESAIVDANQDVFHFACQLRSETPTMIKAAIEGKPRAFEKKYLLSWAIEQAQQEKPAVVTMKMSHVQAEKWKLVCTVIK